MAGGETRGGLGGNIVLEPTVVKIEKLADKLEKKKLKGIKEGIEVAHEAFRDSAKSTKRTLPEESEHPFYVVAITEKCKNPRTHVAGMPAKVKYVNKKLVVSNASWPEYDIPRGEGERLTVTFNPDTEQQSSLEFDFAAPDLVEQVLQLGQGISLGDRQLTPEEGADFVMQTLIEASEAVR